MFSKLLQICFIGTLSLSQPAFSNEIANSICNYGKNKAGNPVPKPTLEQMKLVMPQLQSYLGAFGLLQVAHQCELDTTRHAALLFRATEAIGCRPESRMNDNAIAAAKHEESTNYKASVLFKNARNNSAAGVDEVCAAVARFDPNAIEVTSPEDSTTLNRLVRDTETRLRRIWHVEK